MDSFASKIETLEHVWMRAWMQRDRKTMKSLASRDFIYLHGGATPAILDRPSWLEAATGRFRCLGYRFGEVYVRRHGAVAVFTCKAEIEAKMGPRDASGTVWITDLWHRTRVRRNWQLLERVVTQPGVDEDMPREIRELQLWR